MKKTSLKDLLRQLLNPDSKEAKAQESAGGIALAILAFIILSPILLAQFIISVFKAIFAFVAIKTQDFIAKKLGIRNQDTLSAIMFFLMLALIAGLLFLLGFAGRLYRNSKINLGSVTHAVTRR